VGGRKGDGVLSRPSFPSYGLLAALLGAACAVGLHAQVHESPLAGYWYPASASTLRQQVDSLFTHAQGRLPAATAPPVALVVPHAGYQYSGLAAAEAYSLLRRHPVRRVFLLGFSHRYPHRGIAVPDYAQISTPLGVVQLDTEVMQELRRHKPFLHLKQLDAGDHSVEIQLPFLQQALNDFTVVPLYVGELSEKELQEAADALSRYLEPGNCFVASSDFTHYGPDYSYEPFPNDKQTPDRLRELDAGAIEKILQLRPADFQSYVRRTGSTICGRKPILLLLHLLARSSQVVEGRVLEYYASGHVTNDFTNSVSYAAIAFSYFPPPVAWLEPGEQQTLLKLARDAIHRHLEQEDAAPLDLTSYALTPHLREAGAVFVTLRMRGELRGCIGQLQSFQPLYEAVRQRAVAAAVADPRFSALQPAELQNITVEISVLHPLRRLADWKDVKLGRDGIMIRKGDQGAIFLPEVATEFRYSRPEFWAQLCQKAGLPRDAYREKDAELYAFPTQAFAESQSSKRHLTDQ
jgi:AmmeMemoRadiSam system protein B/AmmeMemoRadiSam system protein A